MISIKWMSILVVCQTAFCIDQPYRLVENTTCLTIKDKDRLNCPKEGEYHCLLDENYINEYEVCREWKWIPTGKCAYFNTYNRGNVDERDCKPTQGLTCASSQHSSTESTKYNACYMKKETTIKISTISTRAAGSSNGNTSSIGQTTPTNSFTSKQSHPGSALGITFGILIPVILVVVAVLLIKYRKILENCRKGSEGDKKTLDIERNENEEEKLLGCNEEERKQNLENKTKENQTSSETSEIDDSQRDSSSPKSERVLVQEIPDNQENENSDTESTPLYVSSEIPAQTHVGSNVGMQGKKKVSNETGERKQPSPVSFEETEEKKEKGSNEEDDNQSNREAGAEREKKEVSTNSKETEESSVQDTVGNPDKECMQEEKNQRDRTSNEDNKEKTSSEEEDTGGMFDDTLESIKRKDDEEKGGNQDLHNFLEEVATQLAKKMLYHILKSHLTDPQSYLNDESKVTSVKELLPAEYQASVRSDPINKNIPVMYAILQLSLKDELQPKSGWGQGVKDSDTGVGDDVERLYRVHTLYREIADPEQVSLAGYTRLFKVLFEAVARLDVKGNRKEDYQEFVQKWENLQRNQWFKDNLKALQSFFKKWSLGSDGYD